MGAATRRCCSRPSSAPYMKDRVREIRGRHRRQGDLLPSTSRTTASSPNGCIAGGKHLLPHQRRGRRRALRLHPLLRARTSAKRASSNVCRQPLFLKLYRKGQPFNDNLLRPCPMLENPERLPEMVASAPAHIRPTSKRRRAPSTCAISAMPTPRAGSRRLKSSGPRRATRSESPFRSNEKSRFRGSFFSLLKSLAEFRVRRRESDMIRFLPRPARGRKHFARSER